MVEQEQEMCSADIASLFKSWENQEMSADGKSRLNPEASEFVPGGKSEKSLNPEASEFVPGAPPKHDGSTGPGNRPEHVGRVIMVNHQQGWAMLQSPGLDNLFCYLSQVREPLRLREGMMVIFEVMMHQGGRPMVMNVRQYMGEGKGKGKGKGMFPPDAWAEWFAAKGKGKGADMEAYMMSLMSMYGKGKGKGEDPYASEEFRKFMMARGMDPMSHWRSRMMGPRGMMYPPKMPPVRRRDATQGMMQLFQAMSSQSNKSEALQKMLQSLLSNPSVLNQISSNPTMQSKLHSLMQFLSMSKGEKGEGKGAQVSSPSDPAVHSHGPRSHGPVPHASMPQASVPQFPPHLQGGSPSKVPPGMPPQAKDQQKFYGSVLREACSDPSIQQLLRTNKQAQLILHALITGGPTAVRQFRDNPHAKMFLHALHKAMKDATSNFFERSSDANRRISNMDVAAATSGIDHMFSGFDVGVSMDAKDISKLLEQTPQTAENDALASVFGKLDLEDEDSLENVLNAAAEAAGSKDSFERQNSNFLDTFKKNEVKTQPKPAEEPAIGGMERITGMVVANFEGSDARQLSVKVGTPIMILKISDDWSFGMLRDGSNGWFPTTNWSPYDLSSDQQAFLSPSDVQPEESFYSPDVGPSNVVDNVSDESVRVVWDGPRPPLQEVAVASRVWSREKMLSFRNSDFQTQPAVISHIKVVQVPEKKRRRRDKEEKDDDEVPPVTSEPRDPGAQEAVEKEPEWWNAPSAPAGTGWDPSIWGQSEWDDQADGKWNESSNWWKQEQTEGKPWSGKEEWPEWWEGGEDNWEKDHLEKTEQYNSIKEENRETASSGTILRSRNTRSTQR